ncbi:hypothetical protein [Paraburkholderia adhaesiva]|uniref:hypothetical protein n=1 Tax=Paraburkholderia adhaesiva TaxID=2883244 RepID=UPI001F1E1D65|nr:hypothetical protein [Paraburkholderia adhaesiva]
MTERPIREKGDNDGDRNIAEEQKEYLIGQILTEFLMNIEVSLPRPNSSTLENQVTALETYTKALDAGLEAWLSEKFFTVDTGGDVAAKIEVLKEVAKAYFVRLYMIENGMLPELAQLTTMDEDGKPLVDVFRMQTEHIEQLQKAFGDFFKGLLPITNRANEKFKTIQDKSTTEATGTDTYSSGQDMSGGEGGGFGGWGAGGDMGGAMGSDMGTGEMPEFGGGGGFGGGGMGEGETAPTPSEFGTGKEPGEETGERTAPEEAEPVAEEEEEKESEKNRKENEEEETEEEEKTKKKPGE